MVRHITRIVLGIYFACGLATSFASSNTHFVPTITETPVLDRDFVVPKILVDSKTGVIYYLESDGRHVSAISPKGKLLWHVDPFVEAKLNAPGGNFRPIIGRFEFAVDASDFISVSYNSSVFGSLRKSDGVFVFIGED